MKQKIIFILVSFISIYTSIAQSTKTCTISCNVASSYVCPNSNTWKNNPKLYNDDAFMKEIGYTKDSKGCWKLDGSSIKIQTTDKNKAEKMWAKITNYFSGAQKTGF